MTEGRISPEKYLKGLERPEPPQDAKGKDGDPQLAALHQILLDNIHFSPDRAIIDIGSGRGVLATAIDNVWKDAPPPKYIAVDIDKELHSLSLPTRIHNNSLKIEFEEFLTRAISEYKDKETLVVIRNVFHELDIQTTGFLIHSVNSKLGAMASIYIQDMKRLPVAERGNAGWDPNFFLAFLRDVGMPCVKYDLASFGGTGWFALKTSPGESKTSLEHCTQACATQRQSQKEAMLEEIRKLNTDYDEKTSGQIQIISIELANKEMQLGTFNSLAKNSAPQFPYLKLGGFKLPLRPSSDKLALSVASDGKKVAENAGLVGTIATKDAIDMPKLLLTASNKIWFMGYSNRPTFDNEENCDALERALNRGVKFRAIMAHPESPAVLARGRAHLYKKGALREDILLSLQLSTSFIERISDRNNVEKISFEIRLTQYLLPCSCFFVDEFCYASFYTNKLTGEVAPTLIFRASKNDSVGFYEILQEDFTSAFEHSPQYTAQSWSAKQ